MIVVIILVMYVFFFKQKTAYEMRIIDWSSDVCSSDLIDMAMPVLLRLIKAVAAREHQVGLGQQALFQRQQFGRRALEIGQLVHAEIGRASCRERVCQYV